MNTLIIDEFAMAAVEGRKPRLTAMMVKVIVGWYNERAN